MITRIKLFANEKEPIMQQIETQVYLLESAVKNIHHIRVYAGLSEFKQIRNCIAYAGNKLPLDAINFELAYFTDKDAYEIYFQYEKHLEKGLVIIECLN